MNARHWSNVTLLPGSLLPYKTEYQRVADELPRDSVLICLPPAAGAQRRALLIAAALLEAAGHRVATVSSESFPKLVKVPSGLPPRPNPRRDR